MKLNFMIKAGLRRMVRIVMRAFFLFPVRKNKVVFISFSGKQMSCSPKYIMRYLLKEHPGELELIWMLHDPKAYLNALPQSVRRVKTLTAAYYYHLMTARVIVSNNGIHSYVPLRKSQVYLETWHGGGAYKKVGNDDAGSDPRVKREHEQVFGQCRYFISSCRRFSEVMSRAVSLPAERMLEIGMPRNDIFFTDYSATAQATRAALRLPPNSTVVLYAPTFRGDDSSLSLGGAGRDRIDTKRIVQHYENLNRAPCYFLFRTHYKLTPEKLDEYQMDVSGYPDMQELLCAADVLITDYSSSMWDFSFTGKPCFIYAPDLADYRQERDFYTPVSSWPFPVAADNDMLMRHIERFDPEDYRIKVKRHQQELGSFETGGASKTAGEIVYGACYGQKEGTS